MLLIDLDDSVNKLGSLGESLGSKALGDERLNNDLLIEFENWITQNGLRIGRWKLMIGNGDHFFIVDTKREGYYRFNKTCM